jgi:hypothetical protein
MEHKCNGCKNLAIDDTGLGEAAGVYRCAITKYPTAVTFVSSPGKCDHKEFDEITKLEMGMMIGAATAGLASCEESKRPLHKGEKMQAVPSSKPALGLEPPEFIYEDRIRDILAAITRKLDQESTLSPLDYKHMAAWATELKGILTLMQHVKNERLG